MPIDIPRSREGKDQRQTRDIPPSHGKIRDFAIHLPTYQYAHHRPQRGAEQQAYEVEQYRKGKKPASTDVRDYKAIGKENKPEKLKLSSVSTPEKPLLLGGGQYMSKKYSDKGGTSGTSSRVSAHDLFNQANCYSEQGRHEEAKRLYKRALAIREQEGPNHPDTATILNGLANVYQEQRKYGQAKQLYKRALAIYERELGPEHLDTARTLYNLANVYKNQGKYGKAEPWYKRALAICEQELGPEHSETTTILNNLANLYFDHGKHEKAEQLYLYHNLSSLRSSRRSKSPEHPQRNVPITSLDKGSSSYHADESGFHEQVRTSSQLDHEMRKKQSKAYYDSGEKHRVAGQNEKALNDFKIAITLDRKNAWAIGSRGQTYQAMGQSKKALDDFDEALALDRSLDWVRTARDRVYQRRNVLATSLRSSSSSSSDNIHVTDSNKWNEPWNMIIEQGDREYSGEGHGHGDGHGYGDGGDGGGCGSGGGHGHGDGHGYGDGGDGGGCGSGGGQGHGDGHG
jgi:tetratricopeptide (TPR) repeat protein